ncbi:MAG TPA: hypothetical protein VMW94_00170, partial [Actinomycetes bacterium]|nr:hypothetical protein [Actinomycetes bacterium]
MARVPFPDDQPGDVRGGRDQHERPSEFVGRTFVAGSHLASRGHATFDDQRMGRRDELDLQGHVGVQPEVVPDRNLLPLR